MLQTCLCCPSAFWSGLNHKWKGYRLMDYMINPLVYKMTIVKNAHQDFLEPH